MDKILKIGIVLVAIVVIASLAVFAGGLLNTISAGTFTPVSLGSNTTVYYFYGQGCPHCQAIEPFMDNLTQKYPDVTILKLEVWYNQTNQQIDQELNAQAGLSSPPGVPEVIIGKTVLVGQQEIPDKLEGYVQAIEKKKQSVTQ
jgi:thiol-disulfide isomerase/thioredoxin